MSHTQAGAPDDDEDADYQISDVITCLEWMQRSLAASLERQEEVLRSILRYVAVFVWATLVLIPVATVLIMIAIAASGG